MPTTYNPSSHVLNIKQLDGEYKTILPVTVTDAVYHNLENEITLATFLANIREGASLHTMGNANARFAANPASVKSMDFIYQTDTMQLYLVIDNDKLSTEAGYYPILNFTHAELTNSLSEKAPNDHAATETTYGTGDASKYGHVKLSDSVNSGDNSTDGVAATPAAVKSAYDLAATANTGLANKANASHNHDASSITSGTISIDRLPHGALERCVVVADDTARLALTTVTAQTGDTVKVTSSGIMYFIKDDTKFGTANVADAFEVYTAGHASTVPWAGIESKPSSFTPESHASTDTSYGEGNGSNYGHVKLSDDVNNESNTSGGIAATPAAVKSAYDLANTANVAASSKMNKVSSAVAGNMVILNSDGSLSDSGYGFSIVDGVLRFTYDDGL